MTRCKTHTTVTAYQLFKADSAVIQRAKEANPNFSDNKELVAYMKEEWKSLSTMDFAI